MIYIGKAVKSGNTVIATSGYRIQAYPDGYHYHWYIEILAENK